MPPRATDLATRPPAVAGQFYDADPHQLGSEVRRLLALAPRPVTSVRPKAIIVPHAAYLYSGQVAATAFAALAPSVKTIERIVLIGPAHYVPFDGLAAPTVEAFETPLGPVPLDRDALAAVGHRRPALSRARARGRAAVSPGAPCAVCGCAVAGRRR